MKNVKEKPAKDSMIKEFMIIPGVGKSIANDFWNIGLKSLKELKNGDPQAL